MEKEHFYYAGLFMIYMQAIRFLTDYLHNDVYYTAKYEGHNLNRAKNQISLLEKLLQKEQILKHLVGVHTDEAVAFETGTGSSVV